MATDPHAPDHGHGHGEGLGHETTDVDVSRAPLVLVASVVFLAVVLAAVWLMFQFMERRLVEADRPLPPLSDRQPGEDRLPPEPRLVVDEPAHLARFRAQEDAKLAGIEQAMAALVDRGLPAAAEAPEAPPANPAAGSPAPAIASRAAREAAPPAPVAAPVEEATDEAPDDETPDEEAADEERDEPQSSSGASPREP